MKDEESGNYFTDKEKKSILNEVLVDDQGKVYAVESTGIVMLSPVDNVTQIAYTPDPTAKKDT